MGHDPPGPLTDSFPGADHRTSVTPGSPTAVRVAPGLTLTPWGCVSGANRGLSRSTGATAGGSLKA